MPGPAQRSLSVLVMTCNEEKNMARCLRSVEGLGSEILILDSFSTDNTVSIARQFGARVEQFAFDTYASQRRRLMQLATHDWIFMLDADEEVSDELRTSVLQAPLDAGYCAYTSNRRNRIGNKWMKHGSWYPDRKIRMFDRRKVSLEGEDVHETLKPVLKDARIGHLAGDLLHYADADIGSRFQKVRLYSIRAAQSMHKQGRKTNWMKILFKPMVRFISVFLIRAGILDGFYGYVIACSEAHYVWLKEVQLLELNKKKHLLVKAEKH